MTIFLYIVCFSIFCLLQALFCNGVHECFKGSIAPDGKADGMILFMLAPKFFNRNRQKFWAKTYTCVRCMAGWAGTLSYWGIILPVFGFRWIELIIWVFDIFILVSLNYFVYKHL